MRPTREAYARGYASDGSYECSVGIELQPTDNTAELYMFARYLARLGLGQATHTASVGVVETEIVGAYPSRAYFIETEQDGMGVQVYMPFGMPRTP